MNLTSLIKQLDKVENKHHQVDCKFMTPKTLNKKYHNMSQITNINNTGNNNINVKLKKHRYYKDIEQDQIEDQNIFGFSFFQYIFSNKNKRVLTPKKMTESCLAKNYLKNNSEIKNIEGNRNVLEVPARKERPKTSLIPQRGVPTKRRIHHNLSVSQLQKPLTSENLALPSQLKQQFFTEALFNFHLEDKENEKKNNLEKASPFVNQISKRKTKKLQRSSIKIKGEINSSLYNFKSSYQKGKEIRDLKKKEQYCLDFGKIQQQKVKFNKNIEIMFQTLSRKQPLSAEKKLMLSKSMVYQKKKNPSHQNENVSEIEKNLQAQSGFYNYDDYENFLNFHYQNGGYNEINLQQGEQESFEIKRVNFQTQLTQKARVQTQKLFLKQKIIFDIETISLTNTFFMESHQLTELKFEPHARMSSSFIQEQIIKQIINSRIEIKQFKDKSIKDFGQKPKRIEKPLLYNVYIFVGSTFQCMKLEGLKVKQEGFSYGGKLISILQFCQNLLWQRQMFDFIHVLITSYSQRGKHLISSRQQIQQQLVFETFIHNSDINYFQGREVEIQYFRYFLKRFITFDANMKNRKQIEQSMGMILQSEMGIPLEFEQYCRDISVKGNMNIFTFRSNQLQKSHQPLLYRCFNINLSGILNDAHKSIQMIKKELLEQYNWKGVSLRKQLHKDKIIQLEHFYI